MNSAFRAPNSAFIKVLLVDDSPIALKIIGRILSTSPDIKIVGTARDGREGLELLPQLNPDVICTDLHMPVMDGLEFVKEVMARYPRPILVISVSVQEGSQNIFKLLEAGAVDVFAKPRSGVESEYEKKALELVSKVKLVAGVHVFHRPAREAVRLPSPVMEEVFAGEKVAVRVVAIGASTGGPQTLNEILSQLPANFPVPVVCVQHIGDEFLEGFIEWLASQCRMKVQIARPGEFPQPGTIYFPQAGTHLKIDRDGRFSPSFEPPYDGHRPSVTLMFRSVADFYGSKAICILLTGMGRDGAEGMQEVMRQGGITIAQDEGSSIVFGMPKAAIELRAARYVLSPQYIVRVLNERIVLQMNNNKR